MELTNKTKKFTVVRRFSMVAEYKINISKSIVFLYTSKKKGK